MEEEDTILLSSFLSGYLLKKNNITYIELVNGISTFETLYNCTIIDDGIDKLLCVVRDTGDEFLLKACYDSLCSDGTTVYSYLYNMTDDKVRSYFDLLDSKKNDNFSKKVKLGF